MSFSSYSIRFAILLYLAAACTFSDAGASNLFQQERTTREDTLRLGVLHRNSGYFHHLTSVGARVSADTSIDLIGVTVPIVAPKGVHSVVRVLSSARDGSVPTDAFELAAPVRIVTTVSGPQNLHIEFPQPVRIDGAQYFIVLDSLDDEMKVITTTGENTNYCQCPNGAFTQQVVNEKGSWKTAPNSFPWLVRYRTLRPSTQFHFKADTVESNSAQTSGQQFFLHVADVNGDGIADILCPSGLFMGNGSRRFKELAALRTQSSSGAWTQLNRPAAELIHVDSVSADANDTMYHVERGVPSVRVRSFNPHEPGQVKAAWLLSFTHSGIEQDSQFFAVVMQDTSSAVANSTLLVVRATSRQMVVVNKFSLPLDGTIESVAATTGETGANTFTMIAKSAHGLEHLIGRIDRDTMRAVSKMVDAVQYLEVAGPGLGIANYGLRQVGAAPVLPAPIAATTSPQQQLAEAQRLSIMPHWDSDRRSSVVYVDLDRDGVDEILFPTSD